MRVTDSHALRAFANRSMSRLRNLVALLCMLGIVVSTVLVIRPAPGVARTLQAHETMVTETRSVGTKKPCERDGLPRIGTICSSIAFIGSGSAATGTIRRAAVEADLRPAHRVALPAQWLSGSPFRPPRIQA